MADGPPEGCEVLSEATLRARAAARGLEIAPERLGDVLAGARRLEESCRLLARFVTDAERAGR